jgi:hypothetical protein
VAWPQLAVLQISGAATPTAAWPCTVHCFDHPSLLSTRALPAGQVDILSYPDMRRQRSLRGHTAPAISVAVDAQQRYIATGGNDAVACLWDAQVSSRWPCMWAGCRCVCSLTPAMQLAASCCSQDYICQRTFVAMDYPIRVLRCALLVSRPVPSCPLLVGAHDHPACQTAFRLFKQI